MENIKYLNSEQKEALSEIIKSIQGILPIYQTLCSAEYLSEEEEKIKQECSKTLEKLYPYLEDSLLLLQYQLLQQSKEMVLNAKIQGERGNAEMLEFYNKLKNSYQEVLKEGLTDN